MSVVVARWGLTILVFSRAGELHQRIGFDGHGFANCRLVVEVVGLVEVEVVGLVGKQVLWELVGTDQLATTDKQAGPSVQLARIF